MGTKWLNILFGSGILPLAREVQLLPYARQVHAVRRLLVGEALDFACLLQGTEFFGAV